VVLGVRSYEQVLGSTFTQALQQGMGLFGTLLFIGCGEGLKDPNFSALREFLAHHPGRHRHFRLERDDRCDEIRKEHGRDGVSVIGFGPMHADLANFLREPLAPAKRTESDLRDDRAPPGAMTLPPKPARCIGREQEVETLVEALLAGEPTPVLGTVGIGKSTVCLEALHNSRVVERFGARRYFVRLDGAYGAQDILAGVGAVLGIPADQASIAKVLGHLAPQPAALALDNLETPWEAETPETEALLAQLATVPRLSLAVTLRSGNRPGEVAWGDAVKVGPLGVEDAKLVFLAIVGGHHASDVRLGPLLAALDGVPLAIKLMAHAAEAEPDLAGISQRWQTERTEMLKRETSDDRLINIGASLELSIKGPRMTELARRLLALFGVLPDGIAHGDLEALLPGSGNAAAGRLRQVALAFDEAGRLRVLAPVREHVAAHHAPAPEDLARAIDHYSGLATELGPKCGREGGAGAVSRLSVETANIESMLLRGLKRREPRSVIEATGAFAGFQRCSGLGTAEPLDHAVATSKLIDNALAARAVYWRGLLASDRADHNYAREHYEEALQLFRRVGDEPGEANCIMRLGHVALARSDHDGARYQYEAALPLLRRVDDVLGEAYCIKGLGDIALERSDCERARERYEEALPLFRRVGDELGEANCIQRLGDTALRRSDHDGARVRYEAVLPLYRRVGDVRGEANCVQGLGDIALARSDHDGARERYEEALPLYRRVGAMRGEANCIYSLGDIALARSEHERAREHYEEALPLYRRVGAVLGEANCIKSLGDIALARSEHERARERYEEALPLYRRVGDLLGEADCLLRLGDIALGRSDRDTARQRYDAALGLYARIQKPYSIGLAHHGLAGVARENNEHARHIAAAREAWLSIGREDLVRWLDQVGSSAI
jgi:tetratricopeptide (TPR) repeat protein